MGKNSLPKKVYCAAVRMNQLSIVLSVVGLACSVAPDKAHNEAFFKRKGNVFQLKLIVFFI